MILLAAALAFLVAVALLISGIRGRWVADRPRCRRCGYDLTGRAADTVRCSECGADLNGSRAVIHRRRASRRSRVVAGAILIAPTSAWLALSGWDNLSTVNWQTHKPVWWLRHNLNGNRLDRQQAMSELSRRLTAGQLASAQTTTVIDRALNGLAGPQPVDPGWSAFLQRADSLHLLDGQQRLAFIRLTVVATLDLQGPAVPGKPVPVMINGQGSAAFAELFSTDDWRVDGKPVSAASVHWPQSASFSGRQGRLDERILSSRDWPAIDLPSPLAVGQHKLSTKVHVEVFEVADMPLLPSRTPNLPDGVKWIATIDLPVSTDFVVTAPPGPTSLP